MRRIFETSLERLGRMIATQHDINVIFEGKKICTDGKTIWLPSCDDLSDELMADMNGFLDHEVAHCLFTDFSAYEKHILKGRLSHFHKQLENACEDERIERCIIDMYPGCRVNLKVINDKFGGEAEVQIKSKEIPWPLRLIFAIRAEMSYDRDPILDDETQPYFDAVKDLIPGLNDCIDTTGVCKVTAEITQRIFDKYDEEKSSEGEKDKDLEGEGESGEGEGESGESESKGGKSASGESKDSKGKSKGEKGEGDESDSESGSESEGESEGDTRTDAEKMMGDTERSVDKGTWEQMIVTVDDRMKKLVEGELGKVRKYIDESDDDQFRGGKRKHIPYTTQFDTETNYTGKGRVDAYRKSLARVSKYVNPIRRTLERVLKTQENKRWRSDRERGAVDTRALARLATDRNFRKPFKEQVRSNTDNVAVEILIDQSGSMGGSRIQIAKDTAIALAEALKDLNIEFEVTGFHTAGERRISIPREAVTSGIFNRYNETMQYSIFKEFGATNLSGIEKIFVGENNCDPEAVQWAADRLSTRREKRKVLIVLSDGYPAASSASSKVMGDQLRLNVAKISKAGIEVIGIGIESDSVRRFYPDYIIVNELNELPAKAMAKLAKIITKAA